MGGHVLQRASVDDGLKPYVSAQRGSNKHQSSPSCSMLAVFAGAGAASRSAQAGGARVGLLPWLNMAWASRTMPAMNSFCSILVSTLVGVFCSRFCKGPRRVL